MSDTPEDIERTARIAQFAAEHRLYNREELLLLLFDCVAAMQLVQQAVSLLIVPLETADTLEERFDKILVPWIWGRGKRPRYEDTRVALLALMRAYGDQRADEARAAVIEALRDPSEELVEATARAECNFTAQGLWESALTDRDYRRERSRAVLAAIEAVLANTEERQQDLDNPTEATTR